MSILGWGIAAVVAGIGVIAIGVRVIAAKHPGPPLDEPLPATILQRTARRGLLIGGLLSLGLVALVLYAGPQRVIEDAPVRIGFTVLLVLILVVFAWLTLRVMSWVRREDGTLDERDRAILNGSQGLRSVAILMTLVVWMIGLQESFWSQGAVPIYYLNLVFWSCLVVSLLAFPLGILAGYWRQ